MAETTYDLVILGAGPGGYVAAIRAAQLGMRVACLERDALGGICLNWGCIPTKALLKSAEYAFFLQHAKEFGFTIEKSTVDFSAVIKRSRDASEKMTKGVAYLFKKNKVEHVRGTGTLLAGPAVEVKDADGKSQTLRAKNVIIATGARARMIPGIEVDRKRVVTSTEAMILPEAPSSIVIIGAGAIGVEFAYFFRAFGAQVTLVEMMPQLLPIEDEEISATLGRSFRKIGIETLMETKVKSAKTKGKGVEVVVESKSGETKTLKADYALNAVGVQGNVENIGLEKLGIALERGFIKVNEQMRTNVAGFYAIGDVNGPPWLAHVASHEGIVAAEAIAGKDSKMDYSNVPGCTYCQPQVASVGLTEKQAREKKLDIKVGKFPFTASGKAVGVGETTGMVKLIFDAKYGELLGAHIIGSEATEMIAELVLAKQLEATASSIFHTIHAHPTLSEAVMDAAADSWGGAINI